MALENLVGADKFLSALVPTNPTGGDDKREGDDHLRGIKNTLRNTFPNLTGAVTATQGELSSVGLKLTKSGDSMTGPLGAQFGVDIGASALGAYPGDTFAVGAIAAPNYGVKWAEYAGVGVTELAVSAFNGIRFFTQSIERLRIRADGVAAFAGAASFGAGKVSFGAHNTLRAPATFAGAGTFSTGVSVPTSGEAGGLAIVTGAGLNGVTFAAAFLLATDLGAGPALASAQILRVGGATPTLAFVVSGGKLSLTVGGGNENISTVTLIGDFSLA